jgi:hypothetical protein
MLKATQGMMYLQQKQKQQFSLTAGLVYYATTLPALHNTSLSSEKENPSESLWPEQMSDKMSNI